MSQMFGIISLNLEGKKCRAITKAVKDLNVPKSSICYRIKGYKDTWSVDDRPSSCHPRSMRTLRLIEGTRSKINRKKKYSMRKIAHEE
uniref:Uncharacterized protein n=1 Tax=Lepeophtheirus salmonis TaxID=72036 RepID=A0A0K2U8S8_LEPSM